MSNYVHVLPERVPHVRMKYLLEDLLRSNSKGNLCLQMVNRDLKTPVLTGTAG